MKGTVSRALLIGQAALFMLAALLVSGCLFLSGAENENSSAAFTAGASTLIVRLTMDAGQTAVAQLTQIAGQPNQPPPSPPPENSTALPTQTPPPSNTPLPQPPSAFEPATFTPTPTLPAPTATPISVDCNRMDFIGDISAPLDSAFPANSVFSKIWRVRNSGSCTWTSAYSLVFTGGNLVGISAIGLPVPSVAPGQTVDLGVNLTAPGVTGVYQGTWMLRSDTGQVFGYGPSGAAPLTARITVFQPAIIGSSFYDIATNYCALTWTSQAGAVPCPGSPASPNGSVQFIQNPQLETGQINGYGLWVRPDQDNSGFISGQTPQITILNGQHFVAETGCMAGYPNCDVTFQLEYLLPNGSSGQLGRWRERSNSQTTPVDVDLSSLAGNTISLVLTVLNRGNAAQANAFWLQPRIQSGSITSSDTLVWTREGYPTSGSCNELHIFHTGSHSATAVAYDCSAGLIELGRRFLSSAQVDTLIAYEQSLENSQGEIYSSFGGRSVTTWVTFYGLGANTAADTQLRALDNFAATLFIQIAP